MATVPALVFGESIWDINMSCKYLGLIVSVLVAIYIARTVTFLDALKPVVLHHNTKCEKVSIENPSEDMARFGDILIGAIADSPSMYYKHLSAANIPAGYLISIDPRTKKIEKDYQAM